MSQKPYLFRYKYESNKGGMNLSVYGGYIYLSKIEREVIMTKKNVLNYVVIIVGLISMALIIKTAFSLKDYNKFYNMESEVIVEQYAGKNYTAFSTTTSGKDSKEFSLFLLCGSESIDSIDISENQTKLNVSAKINIGEAKLLAHNTKNNSIVTAVLKDGDNEIILNEGEYKLYAVGKNFCGKININYL